MFLLLLKLSQINRTLHYTLKKLTITEEVWLYYYSFPELRPWCLTHFSSDFKLSTIINNKPFWDYLSQIPVFIDNISWLLSVKGLTMEMLPVFICKKDERLYTLLDKIANKNDLSNIIKDLDGEKFKFWIDILLEWNLLTSKHKQFLLDFVISQRSYSEILYVIHKYPLEPSSESPVYVVLIYILLSLYDEIDLLVNKITT